MKGILKAISIQTYGLYGKDKKPVFQFTVLDPKKRRKIDRLQGKVVDYKEDIKPLTGV